MLGGLQVFLSASSWLCALSTGSVVWQAFGLARLQYLGLMAFMTRIMGAAASGLELQTLLLWFLTLMQYPNCQRLYAPYKKHD